MMALVLLTDLRYKISNMVNIYKSKRIHLSQDTIQNNTIHLYLSVCFFCAMHFLFMEKLFHRATEILGCHFLLSQKDVGSLQVAIFSKRVFLIVFCYFYIFGSHSAWYDSYTESYNMHIVDSM
jgi:hypothetical protein